MGETANWRGKGLLVKTRYINKRGRFSENCGCFLGEPVLYHGKVACVCSSPSSPPPSPEKYDFSSVVQYLCLAYMNLISTPCPPAFVPPHFFVK